MIPLTLITSAIAGAVGFGLAWQLQNGAITELELEHANSRIELQRAARTQTERLTARLATAQNNATTRAVVLRADADRTRDIGNGLRIKTADAVRTAATNSAACPQSATTLGVVFNQCVSELTEMAAIADRHSIDIQALMERQ